MSAAAHFAGTTLPRGFTYTGMGLSAISTLDNYVQLIDRFNINDALQAGIGTTLVGVGLGVSAGIITSPVAVPVVLIGGVGLFIWEQAEGYYGW